MKNIIKSLFVCVFVSAVMTSCAENENIIDQVIEGTVVGGGSLRTITPITSPTIQLGNATARFAVNIEIQDKNNGADTEKIEVYAAFKDNSTANGSNPRAELLLKTIASSEFLLGTRGLLQTTVSATIAELKTRLNLTDAQFTGGDQFTIRLVTFLKDGRTFTNTNSNSVIVGGSYFNSPFLYNVNVVCPISENLAGTHTYVSTNMRRGPSAAGVACGGTVTGTVTWTATDTPGVYRTSDHSFGMFGGSCWGDNPATSATARVTWFCKSLIASGGDQYGDSYTYTITSATASAITLNWISTYNDRGTVVLTRQGGAPWPAIFIQ